VVPDALRPRQPDRELPVAALVPELAASTLDVLASLQGTRGDEFRDEEPGKILHELRCGELTAFEEPPHSPYYGSADGTMLFLILLDEYERFTGDTDRVRRLEPNARAALAWIDQYGDRDGDGYVEYERRNTDTGLENECWKDSWNSILFADGTLAKQPAGRYGAQLQGAFGRGARARLPVALRPAAPGAGHDRHLQPLSLRRGARRPRAQSCSSAKTCLRAHAAPASGSAATGRSTRRCSRTQAPGGLRGTSSTPTANGKARRTEMQQVKRELEAEAPKGADADRSTRGG
jgi:hypothetical protein